MNSIFYYSDGTKSNKFDCSKMIHRLDGPAEIWYNKDGSIQSEEYVINNELHRDNGPAYIQYSKNGSICYEAYYTNGEAHRLDGPAEIWYNKNKTIQSKEWWINGNIIQEKQFDSHPLVVKYKISQLFKKEIENESF